MSKYYFDSFNGAYTFALTETNGKIRIKQLNCDFSRISIAPTKVTINKSHYIEWQIGYDKVVSKNEKFDFIGANGKPKVLYELSEFIKYGFDVGMIMKDQLVSLYNKIFENNYFISNQLISNQLYPYRYTPYYLPYSPVPYSYYFHEIRPVFVYHFDNDSFCEVIVREKQYASGIMPMLYFCLPLHTLDSEILGRVIKSGECATLHINQGNIFMFLKMFEIFGVLSLAHKHDCIEILKVILK